MKTEQSKQRRTTHIGGLETRRIVRDVVPMELEHDGFDCRTVGNLIDERISELLRCGDEIQQITFHFDHESPDAVRNLCDLYGVK